MLDETKKEELTKKLDEAFYFLFENALEQGHLQDTIFRHQTINKRKFVCTTLAKKEIEYQYLFEIYDKEFNKIKKMFKNDLILEEERKAQQVLEKPEIPKVFGVNIFLVLILFPIIFIQQLAKGIK